MTNNSQQSVKLTTDLVLCRAAGWLDAPEGESRASTVELITRLVAEIERLREVLTIPLITPDAKSSALFLRVLAEHEKGQPVNGQDLINALMWRIGNQRKEIAHLHERISTLHELVHT